MVQAITMEAIYGEEISWNKKASILSKKPFKTIIAGDMCGVLDIIKHLFSNTLESIEKPKVQVVDVDLKQTGHGFFTFWAKFKVSNPYCIPIPLGEIRYVLKSSDSLVAAGTIPDTGSIKGNGDTLLYADVNIPHDVMITMVKDIVADWDIDYKLDATLVIDFPIVCDINIPVTSSGEIKLPTIKDLFD